MNTDKQRIYNGDWKTLHPYSGSAPTALYYITLANKVLAAIRAVETSLDESDYRKIDETEQKELACILTAYFEDIISQTGIFQAFTRIHGKRFGKPLPFYTLDEDYTPGEINIEEVQFLVWHYHMQLNNLDIPYSPTLDTFAAIASDVMEIFETEYESAPENEKLLQYFRIDEKESHNLYALHARFLWLCTQSYLFFNNGFLLEDQAESLAEEAKEAGMGEDSPLYASLSSMGHKYTGYFRYENADETITRFRHIATDRIIEATNRSLVGLPRNMKDPSLILRTGFIQWNGEWWLSGQISSYEDSEDLIGQITGDDDEYNLFEPEEELPEEEQRIILTDILATTEGEDGQTLDASDTAWQALLSDEIGKDFFISQVKAGEITGLQFYNAPGRLLLDNIDFVTEYVKR